MRPMIDTICCVLLGLIMAIIAFGHIAAPELTIELLFVSSSPAASAAEAAAGAATLAATTEAVEDDDDYNPLQIHYVAILGGAYACIAIILISLGLFQPSSNARKFALVAYAMMQYWHIRSFYRFPVQGRDHPPQSMMEWPIPFLVAMQSIALVGALGSRTDGERARIVRNKKKAALYVKHAVKVAKKD